MHVIYISNYMKDGVMIADRFCIYDKRSPADDLKCFDPVINLEDSKAGSVSITLPVSHVAYDYIVKGKTMLSVYRLDDDPNYEDNLLETLIFEGPVRKETKTFNKDKNIYVEGFFSFLNETVQPRREFFNVTLHEFMSALISTHNERMANEPSKQFILGNVEINYPDVDQNGDNKSEYESTNFGTTMEYFLAIQEKYGGHYIFSKEGNTYRIDYVEDLPRNESQEILFGENLLDLMSENDLTDICSAVVPISSVSSNSLGIAGETIVASEVPGEGIKVGPNYTYSPTYDDKNRACWAIYFHEGLPDERLIAYYYRNRTLIPRYEGAPPGEYEISGQIGDDMSVDTGYHAVRYFVTNEDERLYISTRIDAGNIVRLWCYYGYNSNMDLLAYQEETPNQVSFVSIKDKELDFSYTPNGQDLYVDRSNNTKGELLMCGQGSELRMEIKRAKYSYSSNPEAGDAVTSIPDNVDFHCTLWTDTNTFPPWKYHVYSAEDPLFSVLYYDIPEDRDFDALLITTRTKDSTHSEYPDVYKGDCLWALYDGTNIETSHQLNYGKIDTNKQFTSVINFKIDLTEAENVGARKLAVSCWGLRDSSDPNPYSAPIVPVIRKCKKYVGKTSEYLTVEGADPTEYHDSGSLVVKDDALVAKYGYIERRLEFSGIEDPNVLEKRSEAYLHDVQFGNVRIDAKAVDLHDSNVKIDALDISTSVRCRSYPHNIDKFFEIKSLTLNLDYPLNNSVSFAEENRGYYKGTLPVSVLTTTNELRNFKLYGTTDGLITPGGASVNDIHITIHNLITDTSQTIDIARSEKLVYPDYVTISVNGTYTDFEAGLIEITTTSMDSETGEYPMVEFEYDKTKDGE